ncbi:MAG: hypothetical protein FWG70_04595 [Oscillospiraceae bacterium]|nr:hypothetical protein [Oscillospiraceae bacterium]
MKITGASGAIPRKDIARMDEHAERFYGAIRKRTSDIEAIAKNTGLLPEDVKKIKQHIFINEYELGEDEPRKFDPNYDMAVSWQRLIDGKDIREMDIVLLKHELTEFKLMKEKSLPYEEAHKIASKQYNYHSYTEELDLKEGVK